MGQNTTSLPAQSNPRILYDVLTFENGNKVIRVEIKKFRTPFAQELGNNGETVTYSLRA